MPLISFLLPSSLQDAAGEKNKKKDRAAVDMKFLRSVHMNLDTFTRVNGEGLDTPTWVTYT